MKRIFAWALLGVTVALDLTGWAATIHLGWVASAPHHATAGNRAMLLGLFSFFGIFLVMGAAVCAQTVEENR